MRTKIQRHIGNFFFFRTWLAQNRFGARNQMENLLKSHENANDWIELNSTYSPLVLDLIICLRWANVAMKFNWTSLYFGGKQHVLDTIIQGHLNIMLNRMPNLIGRIFVICNPNSNFISIILFKSYGFPVFRLQIVRNAFTSQFQIHCNVIKF